jgi:hypothetical protein
MLAVPSLLYCSTLSKQLILKTFLYIWRRPTALNHDVSILVEFRLLIILVVYLVVQLLTKKKKLVVIVGHGDLTYY